VSSDGYRMGEMERIALANANTDLRSDLLAARQEIERLRAAVERLHSALTPLSVYGMVDDMQELCEAFTEARRER